jgi:hypothetical protein
MLRESGKKRKITKNFLLCIATRGRANHFLREETFRRKKGRHWHAWVINTSRFNSIFVCSYSGSNQERGDLVVYYPELKMTEFSLLDTLAPARLITVSIPVKSVLPDIRSHEFQFRLIVVCVSCSLVVLLVVRRKIMTFDILNDARSPRASSDAAQTFKNVSRKKIKVKSHERNQRPIKKTSL